MAEADWPTGASSGDEDEDLGDVGSQTQLICLVNPRYSPTLTHSISMAYDQILPLPATLLTGGSTEAFMTTLEQEYPNTPPIALHRTGVLIHLAFSTFSSTIYAFMHVAGLFLSRNEGGKSYDI